MKRQLTPEQRKEKVAALTQMAYERDGVTIMTQSQIIPGFWLRVAGHAIISVDSKLPRSERSAQVNRLMTEVQHAQN